MTERIDELRAMRDFIDREIAAELRLMDAPMNTVRRAAELYGIAITDLLSGSRVPQVAKARQAAAWLLRGSGMSLTQIGAILGCHHTTALYACRKIDASPSLRALLDGIEVVA